MKEFMRSDKEIQSNVQILKNLYPRSKPLDQLLDDLESMTKQRDEWRRRAAAHGCNIDDGDIDCG